MFDPCEVVLQQDWYQVETGREVSLNHLTQPELYIQQKLAPLTGQSRYPAGLEISSSRWRFQRNRDVLALLFFPTEALWTGRSEGDSSETRKLCVTFSAGCSPHLLSPHLNC